MKPLQDEARRIIDEAHATDVPTPEREARVWEALAGRLDGPLPPTAEAASSALGSTAAPTFLSGLGVKLLIGAAALGGLSALGLVSFSALGANPTRLPEKPLAERKEQVRPAVDDAPPAPAQPGSDESAQSASTLLAETRLLAAAQRALSSATPDRALALLDRHRARFPHGELVQERDAAQVLALCAVGRVEEAHKARQLFLQDWPTSPLVARIRAGCGKPPR